MIDRADKGKVSLHDVVAPFGSTGTNLLFTHQSVLGIDNKYVDGTGSLHASYIWTLTVNVTAPNHCWKLDLTSWRKGEVGAYHDGNNGWAHAGLGAATCTINGSPISALTVGGGVSLTNSGSPDSSVTSAVSTSNVTHQVMGEGSQSVTIQFRWDAFVTSTVTFLSGGDEGLVQFGLNPSGGNSEFSHGTNQPDWGFSTQLKLTWEEHPSVDPCIAPKWACLGGKAALKPTGVSGDNLMFTWFDHNGNVVGTSQNLTFDPVAWSDQGTYTLVISNSCGSVVTCAGALFVVDCRLQVSPFPVPVGWLWGGVVSPLPLSPINMKSTS